MTTFTVTTLVDEKDGGANTITPGGAGLSLREAIELAGGGDTITFEYGLSGGTLNLTMGAVEIEKPLPRTTAPLTIDGDLDNDKLPDITIDAQGASRVMDIAPDVDFVVRRQNTAVTLDGLVITGGNANSDAGIQVRSTDFTLLNSTVTGNHAVVSGGGIGINNTFGGPLESENAIINSTISDNTASDAAGIIFRRAELVIVDSTISDNTATGGYVGGIRGFDARPLTMVNSTVSGNAVSGDTAHTGGINVSSGFTAGVTLDNVTISGNSATGAGAVTGGVSTFESLTIRNSIIAGNEANGAARDVNGTITTSNGANAFGQATVDGAEPGDLLGADPAALFENVAEIGSTGVFAGVLADNGGRRWTIALAPEGPAIDAGEDIVLAAPGPDRRLGTADDQQIYYDERGPFFFREVDLTGTGSAGIDIGAFELQRGSGLFTPDADFRDLRDHDLAFFTNTTNALEGDDWVRLSETQNLGVKFRGGDGRDRIIGSTKDDYILGQDGDDNLSGRAGNDQISGGSGDDIMNGNRGDDWLLGRSGDDTLSGGKGNDTLFGGPGADILDGGWHRDRFDFNDILDSTFGAGRDVIVHFDRVGPKPGDRMDLSDIDAIAGGRDNAFAFIGTAAFTARGQLRVFDEGGDTVIAGNTTGNLRADFQIVVEDGAVAPSQWHEADFIV